MSESNKSDLIYGSSLLGGISALLLYLGFQLYYTRNISIYLSIKYIYLIVLLSAILLIIWLFIGFGIAFGKDYYYLIGTSSFGFFGVSVNQYSEIFYHYTLILLSTSLLIKFIESKFPWYYNIIISILFTLVCYCVIVHWIWTSDGWLSPYRSESYNYLLNGCGAIDTSGVSFIFLSTGLSALLVYAVSPYDIDLHKKIDSNTDNKIDSKIDNTINSKRNNKLNKILQRSVDNEIIQQIHVYRYIGFMLCLIGFIGINAVANLPVYLSMYLIGQRIVNVLLSIASSIIVCCLYNYISINTTTNISVHLSMYLIMQHALSACVAISASSSVVRAEGAVIIGAVSSILCILSNSYLSIYAYDIHLPVSIQLINSVWGLLSSGILGSNSGYSYSYADSYIDGTSRVNKCKGLLYGGKGNQLIANIISISGVITLITLVIGSLFLFGDFVVNKYINKLIDREFNILLTAKEKRKFKNVNKQIENYFIDKKTNKTNDKLESNPESKIDSKLANNLNGKEDSKFDSKGDDFLSINGYNWDVCMVFPVKTDKQIEKEKQSKNHENILDFTKIINMLRSSGFETIQYFSIQNDEIYVKIRLDIKHLSFYADVINYSLPLDEEKIKIKALEGKEWIDESGNAKFIKPFNISNGPAGLTNFRPYQYLYGSYDQAPEIASLFSNGLYLSNYLTHPFSPIHRLKIIYNIIQTIYPLHDKLLVQELIDKWMDWYKPPWKQPNDLIKEYFGEHIGLYFYFLAFYTTTLLPLSIIGLLVTFHLIINISIYGSFYAALSRVYSVPIFCLAICIYTQYLCMYWKRNEKIISLKWGMLNYEDNESIRLEYEGQPDVSYIDGSKTIYFSPILKKKREFRSRCLIVLSIFIVIICFSAAFYAKFYFTNQKKTSYLFIYGPSIVSFANAIQVVLLGYVYDDLAKRLNDYENWRTDTEYEDSLISKLFVFNFVNSYFPSFYIAFIKKAIGDKCEANSCMGELSSTLVIILVTKLFISKFTTFITNRLLWIYTYHQETKNTGVSTFTNNKNKQQIKKVLSQAETEYILPYYDRLLGSIGDYNEVSIQYGFLTLFVAATPFAVFLAYLANYVEIRADGYKLLKYSRRPFPHGAQDIGSWYTVFEIISIISVFTNAGIVFYTMDLMNSLSNFVRLWLAIVFLFLAFVGRFIIHLSANDSPKAVNIQIKRNEFIVDKLINCIQDEELDEIDKKSLEEKNIHIYMNEDEIKI